MRSKLKVLSLRNSTPQLPSDQTRSLPVALTFACFLLSTLIGCQSRGVVHPNVLLITVDTLRRDYVAAYGLEKTKTPAMDSVATDGAILENAYCDVTWTTPSMASTMTGTYALRHKLRSNFDRLSPEATTIAEVLKKHGYATGAIIGSYPLDSIYGLDQGFDTYDDNFTHALIVGDEQKETHVESRWADTFSGQQLLNMKKARTDSRRLDSEVTEAATKLLKRLLGEHKPFFLWVHYFGPHSVPDKRLNFLVNLSRHVKSYGSKVERADKAVGGLLKAVDASGIRNSTMVILHADHGEALGEHKFIGHGRYLYQDNLRVPLLVRWPGHIKAGQRITGLVGNVDIAPTILDAAGFARDDAQMDGRSFLPQLRGGSPTRKELYCETYMPLHEGFAEAVEDKQGRTVKVGVRRYGIFLPPWKYVVSDPHTLFSGADKKVPANIREKVRKEELFNVLHDPSEEHNLASQQTVVVKRLKAKLQGYRQRETTGHESSQIKVTPEHVEKLRSLGYTE